MTATHPVDREEVMAWLDGELSPVRAAEVTTHVGSCAECRSLADSFQQVSTDLAPWHVDAPPDHVIAPSLPASGRLERVAGPRDRWSWLTGRSRLGVPRWVFAAAPAVALLFIAVLSPGLERRGPTEMASARAEPVPPPSGPRAVLGNSPGAGGPGGGGGGRGGFARTRPVLQSGQQGQGRQQGVVTDPGPSQAPLSGVNEGSMIARTAAVVLVTDHFDDMRPALERLTITLKGAIGDLQITGDVPNQRTIRGSLRVPADRFDDALTGIRRLGKVKRESQSSEDVGDAHRDLVVRIANAKTEEGRLNQLLARTGRLSDVLDVEREVTRVRGEIERMQAEELSMRNRVQSSTIAIEIQEAYRADLALDPMPLSMRVRNAVVDGWRDAAASLVETALIVMRNGPTLVVWAFVLGGPFWWIWRRSRRRIGA